MLQVKSVISVKFDGQWKSRLEMSASLDGETFEPLVEKEYEANSPDNARVFARLFEYIVISEVRKIMSSEPKLTVKRENNTEVKVWEF